MTNSSTNVTQINNALHAVKSRFVRVPSNTSYPRFRDVITGIEQADSSILLDWYRKNSTKSTPQKSASELLDSLSWVYGDGFLPNGPTVLPGDLQNLWKAPTIKPSGARVLSSAIQPFLEFLDRWFPVESERDYFLWWVAHTVRRPEQRIIATLVLRSEHGVGKGFFAETLMAGLLGKSSVAVCSLRDVTGDFNDCIEGKTFILIDEVYKSKKSTTDALKSFQGNATLPLRRKHKPVVAVDNFINFVITSNDHIPLTIEDGDRRFWVPQFIKHSESKDETGRFLNDTLKPWLVHQGGLQLVRDYLETVDLRRYRATGEPPVTQSKGDISGFSQRDTLPTQVAELIDEQGLSVVTVARMRDALSTPAGQPLSDSAIASALLECGCVQRRTKSARYYITPKGDVTGYMTRPVSDLEQAANWRLPFTPSSW